MSYLERVREFSRGRWGQKFDNLSVIYLFFALIQHLWVGEGRALEMNEYVLFYNENMSLVP